MSTFLLFLFLWPFCGTTNDCTTYKSNPSLISFTENCKLKVKIDVAYTYRSKDLDGQPFPQEASLEIGTFSPEDFTKGTLEVCMDGMGQCKWRFSVPGNNKVQPFVVNIPGSGDFVRELLAAEDQVPDVNSYIQYAREKGAKMTEFDSGVISIRQRKPLSERTSVTIVNPGKNRIIGANIYRDHDMALAAKIINKRAPKSTKNTIALYIFDHKIGENFGQATEIVFKTLE